MPLYAFSIKMSEPTSVYFHKKIESKPDGEKKKGKDEDDEKHEKKKYILDGSDCYKCVLNEEIFQDACRILAAKNFQNDK